MHAHTQIPRVVPYRNAYGHSPLDGEWYKRSGLLEGKDKDKRGRERESLRGSERGREIQHSSCKKEKKSRPSLCKHHLSHRILSVLVATNLRKGIFIFRSFWLQVGLLQCFAEHHFCMIRWSGCLVIYSIGEIKTFPCFHIGGWNPWEYSTPREVVLETRLQKQRQILWVIFERLVLGLM